MVRYIHSAGMMAGIAIKPETSVDVLYELLDSPDKAEIPDVAQLTLCSTRVKVKLMQTYRWSS